MHKANDEARWQQRFKDLTQYRATGNDCPRDKKADNEQEHHLGVWLHSQRISHDKGAMTLEKDALLNDVLPRLRIHACWRAYFTDASARPGFIGLEGITPNRLSHASISEILYFFPLKYFDAHPSLFRFRRT